MEIDDAPLRVRARDERDVHEIVEWITDAAALHLFSGPGLTWPLTTGQLQSMSAIDGLTAWVVVEPSEGLLGHFDLTVDGPVARLGRVIVNPALRGRGRAIALVDLALAQARQLGAETIRLNVIRTNEPAIRTYRRAGFVAVPGDPDRADVTVMERRLVAASR